MKQDDLIPIWILNGSVIGVIHIADIKEILSCALLLVTIGFTLWKWYCAVRRKESR